MSSKHYFALCCKSEGVPILELIKWVQTHRGSIHDLIENAKQYFKIIFIPIFINSSKAVQKFCLFGDEKLSKLRNKEYSDYKLEPSEGEILDLVQEVLAVCAYL